MKASLEKRLKFLLKPYENISCNFVRQGNPILKPDKSDHYKFGTWLKFLFRSYY